MKLDWFYLPPGYLGLVRRLTALATLAIGFIVYNWSRGGPGPYIIPAWRFHQHLLILPLPPDLLTNTLFISAAVACLLIALGARQKWLLALPIVVGAYFGCRDFWAMGSHFVVMLWTYLVALLFEKPGKSCSRRLIQMSVFFCYFYSAAQKLLSPDFMLGQSLQAEMADGWALNTFAAPVVHLGGAPLLFWQLFAWATVALEFYLAFALFSKRLRKSALILGISFHLGISLLLDLYISLFSIAMVIGYLAFLDGKADAAAESQLAASAPESSRAERACAVAFLALMCLVPLRVYAAFERPLNDVTMLDRTPWTFCMFLQRLDNNKVSIRYKTADQVWHQIALKERWRTNSASNDNELYSICSWMLSSHPEAQEVSAEVEFRVNKRWLQHKTVHANRDHTDLVQVVSSR